MKALRNVLTKLLNVLAGVSFIAMVVLTCWQVFTRYVLQDPSPWSEELVSYLLNEFEEDPTKIWESNIFGKSLNELVNEGLHNKLYRMPEDARMKLKETIERIINDGCNGLICIII